MWHLSSSSQLRSLCGRLPGTLISIALLLASGCNSLPKADAQSESAEERGTEAIAVETALAKTQPLDQPVEYTGTTEPAQLISVRSQVEGQLVDVTVDVGDRVRPGQVLAQQDTGLLNAVVAAEGAEVAARQSEVASLQAEVGDARAQVEQARLELQQAQADLDRFSYLFQQGATTEQQVEQYRLAVNTAAQAVRAAQEQVATRQQAVQAARRRVEAQQATVAEAQERQSYSVLTAPVDGLVVERVTEPGNLAQPGDEILKIGNFSEVKIVVQVADVGLASVRLGQSADVRLDAFPDRALTGRITRISPAADPVARLIPIEVTIPNPSGQIGSGLLARVSFLSPAREQVVVPETAIQTEAEQPASRNSPTSSPANSPTPAEDGTLFVIEGSGDSTIARARTVQLGDRIDGQVEILSGLQPGEQYVVRSADDLAEGDPVRLSFTSETAE
ncbi:MAG: efflux RND transporter periplasmic adaptor subunit [Leptolyngbyaceae cyanobacterium SL_7_1]|nr:efflux RND transporter periplasmic adaptor subunit [Leptolyngbyaceae cyanobacterium SL_7_1]